MKKFTYLLIIAVLLFGFSFARAENDDSASNRPYGDRAEKRAEEAKKRSEEMIKKFDNRVASVGQRAEAIVKRLENAQAKVLNIINKAKDMGLDVASAQEHYDLSVEELNKAKAAMEKARSVYEGADVAKAGDKDYRRELVTGFKAEFDAAKEAMKSSRDHLKKSIDALKALREELKKQKEEKENNSVEE